VTDERWGEKETESYQECMIESKSKRIKLQQIQQQHNNTTTANNNKQQQTLVKLTRRKNMAYFNALAAILHFVQNYLEQYLYYSYRDSEQANRH